jgi:hypothetical protein
MFNDDEKNPQIVDWLNKNLPIKNRGGECGEQLELGRLLKFFKVSEVK